MEKTIVDFSKLPVEVLEEYEIYAFSSYKDVFYSLYLDDDEFSPYSLIDALGDMSIPEFISKEPYLYECDGNLYRWTHADVYMDELAKKFPDAVISVVDKGALSYAEQAALFIKENSGVAWEIHKLIEHDNHREDVIGKLKERGLVDIPDVELNQLVEAFERALSKNDGYYEAFWASVDYVIDEYVQANNIKKVPVPPTLDELVREFEHFIEVMKDIRTVEQAKAFEEKFHIPVEINGVSIDEYVTNGGHYNEGKTNENIEWIRYECFGHLWYLYDRFDGKPQFDVYYGEYGDNLLVENTTIDNLKENYSELLLDIVWELAENELNTEDNFGFTMPDGKYHIFVYADYIDNTKVFVIEPNRVVDDAHEPFVGDTYIVPANDFNELRPGLSWCLEQFEADKEVSLDSKLVDATERSGKTDTGVIGKDEVIKE